MKLSARRVVTAHDAQGRAVVSSDQTCADAVSARPGHRTGTIDYAVVLAGEIEMDLDGQVVALRERDVIVQQNTMHNWVNRGSKPCVIAFVLVPLKGAKHAMG